MIWKMIGLSVCRASIGSMIVQDGSMPTLEWVLVSEMVRPRAWLKAIIDVESKVENGYSDEQ